MGYRRHFGSLVLLALVMAPIGAAAGNDPPVAISLQGADAITERGCAGPFTATLRSADSRPVPSSGWLYFWVELEGAAPEWTAFFEDESCRRRVQAYTDNLGDGRSKARLDFRTGVSEREFYVLTKRLESDHPTLKITPRAGGGSSSNRWHATKALAATNGNSTTAVADPRSPAAVPSSVVGIAQSSLERSARLGRLHAFNNWRPRKTSVERFDIESAQLWRDELIVRSERLNNAPSTCRDAAADGCSEEAGHLSAIDLESGDVRRLLSWPLDDTQAPRMTTGLIRQRISGDKLLLQYGTNPARIVVVDLHTGDTVSSEPLAFRIDDFAVHGQHVVISYLEIVEPAGSTGSRPIRYVGFYRLDDFGLATRSWMAARPVVTDDALYSLVVGLSNGASTTVIVTPEHADGSKGEPFEGTWPTPPAGCRTSPNQTLSGPRFYVEIHDCGMVRAIDFAQRRLFHLPWSMKEQFENPAFALSKDYLIVHGQLRHANRGAGDRGRPLYVFDLDAGKWRGRLEVGDYGIVASTSGTNAVALSLSRGCGNKYGTGTAARVLKAPAVVRRLHLLTDDEIGSRGLETARAYRAALTRGKLDRLDRFGSEAADLRALLADLPRIDPDPESASGRAAVGALTLQNSGSFRERLQYPRPVSLSQAALTPYACEFLDLPISASAGGEPVGWMSLTIRPSPVEGSVVEGWVADTKQNEIMRAHVVYRDKFIPTLSVYETAHAGWVRITPTSQPALWINAGTLPADFAASVASR